MASKLEFQLYSLLLCCPEDRCKISVQAYCESHKSGNVVQAERENNMLQAQVSMLMTMLNEADEAGDEEM